ncbi:MAG TPA: choice-of-anchor tandem repeat GloVer-containing protein [Terriglobales bacterium]|nr:choice-of-anchor tandem repeat GloVer-containing protein [Terriglobales bacterium]
MTKSPLLLATLFLLVSSVSSWAASDKVLYRFSGGDDGSSPYAGVILDDSGNLYGTTQYGGAYGYGTVFELSRKADGGWKQTVLHNFNLDGHDGAVPYASLVRDAAGNLYGTTNLGGAFLTDCGGIGCGTVFRLERGKDGAWAEIVLHSFDDNGTDGFNPYANLIFDTHGDLFGTTEYGGRLGEGTVFELLRGASGKWQEKILHDFNYANGASPLGGLVFDSAGNLYGTTEYGGHYTHGTVFELELQPSGSWKENVLHSFNPGSGDGFEPYSGLVIDSSGRLYGTTPACFLGWGAVFQVQQVNGHWKETLIHIFEVNNDGESPYGPLAIDAAGRLYGTTLQSFVNNQGGAGIVFRLSRTKGHGWSETILHQFVHAGDGGNPYSGVVLDSTGNIYGTTSAGGGSQGHGVVFEVEPRTKSTRR